MPCMQKIKSAEGNSYCHLSSFRGSLKIGTKVLFFCRIFIKIQLYGCFPHKAKVLFHTVTQLLNFTSLCL
jgi:hypothetical protein